MASLDFMLMVRLDQQCAIDAPAEEPGHAPAYMSPLDHAAPQLSDMLVLT